jgi:hypothetical protein
VGYGLAEGKGDLLSTSSGQWAIGEFGYNPISNNLGASLAAGTSDALNLGNGDSIDGQCKYHRVRSFKLLSVVLHWSRV